MPSKPAEPYSIKQLEELRDELAESLEVFNDVLERMDKAELPFLTLQMHNVRNKHISAIWDWTHDKFLGAANTQINAFVKGKKKPSAKPKKK